MTHVVILGAGIAGVTAAYALKAKLGPNDEVTVVSDNPYFHLVPSNPWIAMGAVEEDDAARREQLCERAGHQTLLPFPTGILPAPGALENHVAFR